MEVLTSESLVKLKQAFQQNPDILKEDFNTLVSNHNLQLVEHYEFDEGLRLIITDSKNDENDYTNASLVHQALPNLTPAQATDERLWVTLCLNQFKEYVLARWPNIQDGKHYFVLGGFRHLTRNNAIARLWWCNHLAQKMKTSNKVRKEFFSDIDRRQQIIERPTSANSRNVLKVIFEIITEQNETGKKYRRENWRPFGAKINFVGKRKVLPSLSESRLKEILLEKYLEQ